MRGEKKNYSEIDQIEMNKNDAIYFSAITDRALFIMQ